MNQIKGPVNGDGECDDGGNDSRNDVCALGTDCTAVDQR